MPSTEHPQKPCVTQHTQNTFFFFFCRNVGTKQKEDITIIFLPESKFLHSEANTHMHNQPSGKKCLHGEKSYEEMGVNRLNNDSNLYSIRQITKCACSHSLWHLRWLPKSIPHLLVVVQWMHTIHNILNIIRIMLSNDVPLM